MRPGVTSMMRALPCDDVGDDAGLAAGERPRLDAEVVDRHRQQRHRDALAGGQEHVELAARRHRRHLLGEVDQLVGGVTHGRHDHADVVTGLAGFDDAGRDPLDAGGIRDAGTAVLLDDESHDTILSRSHRARHRSGSVYRGRHGEPLEIGVVSAPATHASYSGVMIPEQRPHPCWSAPVG